MKANPFLITQNQQSNHVNLYRTRKNTVLSFIKMCLLVLPMSILIGGTPSAFAATPVISFSQVSDIAVPATSISGATVVYAAPTASEYDETSGNTNDLPVACAPDTGTVFAMGSTSVTCSATSQIDSNIHSSVSFTVGVADMNAPVITLNGLSSETLTVGDSFLDQGATALDDIDGDVTSSITSSSTVDTATVGSYTVTYTVSDVAGNTTSLVRNVEVIASSDQQATSTVDIISSVVGSGDITPSGTTTLTIGDSQTYTVTPQDGYQIDKLVIDGQDIEATTSYTFASTTADHSIVAFFSLISQGGGGGSQNNIPSGPTSASSTTHLVNATSSNQDIRIDWDMATGTLPISGYSYLFDQLASSSPDAVIDTDSTFATTTLAGGAWYFHVQAIDSEGNRGEVLSVGPYIIETNGTSTDTTAPSSPVPTVTQTGSSTATLTWTPSLDDIGVESYLYGFSTSSDALPSILVSGTTTSVDVTLPDGIWYASVQAVDAAGNVSALGTTTTSFIVDTGIPVITLNGTSTVTVYLHDSYAEQGATAFDDIYGDISSSIQILGHVDTDTVGDYTITYAVTDASGNIANPVVRTIHVITDTTAPSSPVPTVTQTGSSTATLTWTPSLDDIGVESYLYGFSTSSDALPSILVSGTTTSVDVTLPDGIWYASVQAVDAAGNVSALGTTTTSFIVDTGIPVITLNGTSTVTVYLHDSYAEQGATAFDDIYGDISSSIQILGHVDTDTVGDYTITYAVTDASGNIANPVVRTIHVITDTTAPSSPVPTVTQTGSSTATLTWTPSLDDIGVESYLYGFSTSSDALPSILVSGTTTSVDVTLPDGIWYASVQAVDAAGNVSALGTTTTSFIVDTGRPSPVTNIVGSIPTSSPTDTHDIIVTWDPSTDDISGIQGYSFVFDTNSNTIPDSIIDTTITSATGTLPYGIYYFHVRSVDATGNVSSVEHYGPFILSETKIIISDTTYNGTYYSFYSPTTQEGSDLGITGSSTLITSVVSSSTIRSSLVASSTITGSQITSSALNNSIVTDSIIRFLNGINAVIDNNIVTAGTFILPTGNTYNVTTPISVGDIENDAPVAGFSISGYDYGLQFKDSSFDKDEHEGVFNDRWTILIDFGDGTSVATTTSSLGMVLNHAYTRSGSYMVTYRITDLQGETSSASQFVAAPFPSPQAVYTLISSGGGSSLPYTPNYVDDTATSTIKTLDKDTENKEQVMSLVPRLVSVPQKSSIVPVFKKAPQASKVVTVKHSSGSLAYLPAQEKDSLNSAQVVAHQSSQPTLIDFFFNVFKKAKNFLGF